MLCSLKRVRALALSKDARTKDTRTRGKSMLVNFAQPASGSKSLVRSF